MTEKRYTMDNGSNEDVCLVDNVTGKEYESDFDEIVDLLNKQEEELQKMRFAFKQKYDYDIEDVVDEIYNWNG